MKTIVNGRLILPDNDGNFAVFDNLSIAFDDKITCISKDIRTGEIVDAQGRFVSPGFINMHIHGIAGADAMDDNAEALLTMQRYLPKVGVTAFLPTTMTESLDSIKCALTRIRKASTYHRDKIAKVLGANVEGPYINPNFKGAQAECNIRTPNFEELEEFSDVIRIITVAPEMIEDQRFIKSCLDSGIILSIGHSGADYETALKAITNGFSHVTHLFNAQTGLHHRRPGIVGAAIDSDVMVELIADNVHVHPMLQRLIWRAKNHSQIILVTDSLRAAGLGDGIFDLGGQRVNVKGAVATLDDGTIAASVATMNKVLANFSTNVGANIAETVELVTKNPAQKLGLYNEIGSLELGKAADIVIFDECYNIYDTFIDGLTISTIKKSPFIESYSRAKVL